MSVKRPRSKRVLQNLAILSATILVFLIGLEITLRLAGYGNVEVYDPDPVLYWKLRPNQDCFTKIGRHPVHINSRGTRGPEFQLPKPPGTFRILSLGDSKTFGWGVSEADTYSARLERLLQEHAGPGTKIEVINAGCNAWSYPQMRFYFRDIGLQYQPDLILIGDGNFWTQFSENNSPEFIESFMNRVRLKNFFRRFATFHYIVEDKFKGLYESQRAKFIPSIRPLTPSSRSSSRKTQTPFSASTSTACAPSPSATASSRSSSSSPTSTRPSPAKPIARSRPSCRSAASGTSR